MKKELKKNTPRTDAGVCIYTGGEPLTFFNQAVVKYSLAAEIEIELAEKESRIQELISLIEDLRVAVKSLNGMVERNERHSVLSSLITNRILEETKEFSIPEDLSGCISSNDPNNPVKHVERTLEQKESDMIKGMEEALKNRKSKETSNINEEGEKMNKTNRDNNKNEKKLEQYKDLLYEHDMRINLETHVDNYLKERGLGDSIFSSIVSSFDSQYIKFNLETIKNIMRVVRHSDIGLSDTGLIYEVIDRFPEFYFEEISKIVNELIEEEKIKNKAKDSNCLCCGSKITENNPDIKHNFCNGNCYKELMKNNNDPVKKDGYNVSTDPNVKEYVPEITNLIEKIKEECAEINKDFSELKYKLNPIMRDIDRCDVPAKDLIAITDMGLKLESILDNIKYLRVDISMTKNQIAL